MEPARFDEMRKGCWDIHARIADMDVAGIWASLCFPSLIAGFAGAAFAPATIPARPRLRAGVERLAPRGVGGHYPERIIPLQLAWLRDPEVAAADVRAQRRARVQGRHVPREHEQPRPAVGAHRPLGPVPARLRGDRDRRVHPHRLATWPPRAHRIRRSSRAPRLFPVHGMLAAADWLWARIPPRFPADVALSEGGIGWVPMLLDRLDYVMEHSGIGGAGWDDDVTPSEAVHATSGSAPSTTRPRCGCATASASTTSWWRATTRTPTRRGPTPRTPAPRRRSNDVLGRRSPQGHVGERVEALPPSGTRITAAARFPTRSTDVHRRRRLRRRRRTRSTACSRSACATTRIPVYQRGARPRVRSRGGRRACSAGQRARCRVTTDVLLGAASTPRCSRRRTSSNIGNDVPLIPLSVDPPDHAKYRRLLDPQFSPQEMADARARGPQRS